MMRCSYDHPLASGSAGQFCGCAMTPPILPTPHRSKGAVLDARPHSTGLVMPPRIPLPARQGLYPPGHIRMRLRAFPRFASTTANAPEVYDVVCVGGGPAGLSLLAGLKAAPITNGLKVALIEGQDIQKNRLQKDASLESFSNRCSSLTPASVKNLQGT